MTMSAVVWWDSNAVTGTITASYAYWQCCKGGSWKWRLDRVGGLVGNNAGTITASYATGTADGGAVLWTMSAAWWDRTQSLAPSPQAMPLAALTGEAILLTVGGLVGKNDVAPSSQAMPLADADGGFGKF